MPSYAKLEISLWWRCGAKMRGTWAILAIGLLIRVTVHLVHEMSMGLGEDALAGL